jgi:hypothetical protein
MIQTKNYKAGLTTKSRRQGITLVRFQFQVCPLRLI